VRATRYRGVSRIRSHTGPCVSTPGNSGKPSAMRKSLGSIFHWQPGCSRENIARSPRRKNKSCTDNLSGG
jgi:hypothetical protein